MGGYEAWLTELIAEQEGGRQRPISLRFDTKPFWKPIKAELGLSTTGAAIALDIVSSGKWTSYSRRTTHYSKPRRYRNPLFTYSAVVGAVDRLDALGLIDHARQAPGSFGWQSALQARPALSEIVQNIVADRTLRLATPRETVILRDRNGNPVDYRDNRRTMAMRRTLARFNEALDAAGLEGAIASPLVRIFNGTFDRGGRLYGMGASWQNIKSEARAEIQIGGEATTELDFKTLHPALLYAQVGAPLPSDCYAVPGFPRKLVKLALLVLINAQSEPQARRAIATHDAMGEAKGTQAGFRMAQTLIETLKGIHAPIARFFHSDAGAGLMNLDAEIAEAVMNAMLMQGVVVLPVHDSFIIQASKRDVLEAAMIEAAHRIGRAALEVDAK